MAAGRWRIEDGERIEDGDTSKVVVNSSAPTEPTRGRILRRGLLAFVGLTALVFGTIQDLRVHGSSMAPLLRGEGEAGDRLLALRPYYWFVNPERYDLVVFERPESAPESATPPDLSGDLFVKRVLGLSGEDVLVQEGDVFIRPSGSSSSPTILRKPYWVLKDLLTVHDRFVPRDPALTGDSRNASRSRLWVIPNAASYEDGELILDARERSADTSVYFTEKIALEDPVNGESMAMAQDVGVCATIRPLDEEFRLRFELREDGDVFTLELSMRAARVSIFRGASADASLDQEAPVDLELGRSIRVRFMNADDRILLAIDDELVLELNYPGNTVVIGSRNDPALCLLEGRVGIQEILIERDVHYTDMGDLGVVKPYSVPSGFLYVLGDNSPKSRDSRHFGAVPETSLRGRPIGILTPASRRRRL